MITIIYTLIICFIGYNVSNDERNRKKAIIWISAILICISGLRSMFYGSGDTYRYWMYFIDNLYLSYSEVIATINKDAYYHVIAKLIGQLFANNFTCVLIVFSLVFVIPVARRIFKDSPNILLSYIILLAMGFFSFSMNGIRQGLAIGFVILSYDFIKSRNLLFFTTCILIASMFHKTALVFLPSYWLSVLPLNKRVLFLYITLFVFFLLYGNQMANMLVLETSVYDSRMESYIGRTGGLTYSGLIQFLLFFGLTFYYYKPTVANDQNVKIYYNMLLFAIIFQTMAVVIPEFFRIAMYYSIFLIILVPKALECVSSANRKSFTNLLIFLLLVYFLFMGSGNDNYKFFWQI